jgi:hypothetical protein
LLRKPGDFNRPEVCRIFAEHLLRKQKQEPGFVDTSEIMFLTTKG